ncbi:hypothetical protein KSU1_C0950 [Candidatus Jettenia caeni]|uniref:Uncharacterized protein n=1 Tax=Candidatus Jettenia caeni TaxID=247490 RepID=I3ILF1_9BACT|nr:hypothetical protein [Candidatus Jettenia sp. AMX1]NUN23725.1 hypothetical protein [Candidatus Jettenia caeni]WKZ14381.1 MAG: hypothetical protein QY317_10745 [Candidatus Jettenia caeni]GAB62546.1 hypothetical protein KSU1_C0950 [Candidatus Jettenia caeni]
MPTKNLTDLTKDELIAEIERLRKELKKKKKYGLVWEKNQKKWLRYVKINSQFSRK